VNQLDLFLIGDIPGFAPQIGRLVSMMNYARPTRLKAVTGLGVGELDYLHDAQSNSIGALASREARACWMHFKAARSRVVMTRYPFSIQLTPPRNLPRVSAVDERHTFIGYSTKQRQRKRG
jgi:hypothetical protein